MQFISRFAKLELEYGEAERGKTMFDTLMMSYPKRTDLWLVYVDALTKFDQVNSARWVTLFFEILKRTQEYPPSPSPKKEERHK